jgi:hypothetical protein
VKLPPYAVVSILPTHRPVTGAIRGARLQASWSPVSGVWNSHGGIHLQSRGGLNHLPWRRTQHVPQKCNILPDYAESHRRREYPHYLTVMFWAPQLVVLPQCDPPQEGGGGGGGGKYTQTGKLLIMWCAGPTAPAGCQRNEDITDNTMIKTVKETDEIFGKTETALST